MIKNCFICYCGILFISMTTYGTEINGDIKNSDIIYQDEMKKIIDEANSKPNLDGKLPTYKADDFKNTPYPNVLYTSLPLYDKALSLYDEALSSENIYKIIPIKYDIKDINSVISDDLEFSSSTAFADMGDAVIIEPGNIEGKTAIFTTDIGPCVCLIAINKKTKRVGLIHIPGAPVDSPLEFMKDYDPLTYDNPNTPYVRMNTETLTSALQDFLDAISLENKNDTEIHLIGGSSNRYLILTVINMLLSNGYNINIRHIRYTNPSKSYRDEIIFDDHLCSCKYNIYVEETGNIYILKDYLSEIINNQNTAQDLKNIWGKSSNKLRKFNTHFNKKFLYREIRVSQFKNLGLMIYANDVKKIIYTTNYGKIDETNNENLDILNRIVNDDDKSCFANLFHFYGGVLLNNEEVMKYLKNFKIKYKIPYTSQEIFAMATAGNFLANEEWNFMRRQRKIDFELKENMAIKFNFEKQYGRLLTWRYVIITNDYDGQNDYDDQIELVIMIRN